MSNIKDNRGARGLSLEGSVALSLLMWLVLGWIIVH